MPTGYTIGIIDGKIETRCEIHQSYCSTFYIFAKSITELMLKSLKIYDKHDEAAKNKLII